jgi:hypothetical protein
VTEAGGRFDSARWWLLDAVASLAPPAHVVAHGARRGLHRRIRLDLGALDGVSGELALAASAVAAAELVALRGVAFSPMLSVHFRERHALGALQSARVLAENAHGSVERCRGHLCAVLYQLNQQCLHGLVEAEAPSAPLPTATSRTRWRSRWRARCWSSPPASA